MKQIEMVSWFIYGLIFNGDAPIQFFHFQSWYLESEYLRMPDMRQYYYIFIFS